jgi:hypothetical protein
MSSPEILVVAALVLDPSALLLLPSLGARWPDPASMPQLLFSRQSLWAWLELKLTVPTLAPPWHIAPCLIQIPLTSWLMGELQLVYPTALPTSSSLLPLPNICNKGFNGTYSAARIGTVWWPILDDEGVRHVLQIPDTYFVASCPMRLLSPQHYSQQIHDHRGTYSTNFGDQVVFVFHKKKFQVTIPLCPSSNVGILRSAPGHQVFSCFVEDAKPPKEPPPAIFAYTVITDDEADDMELQEETESFSTSEDTDNVIFRGPSVVGLPSDFTATIVRPPSDSAVSSVRPPPENTAPVGLRRDPRSVRRSTYSQRPSVSRSKQLSKPSWNQFWGV